MDPTDPHGFLTEPHLFGCKKAACVPSLDERWFALAIVRLKAFVNVN